MLLPSALPCEPPGSRPPLVRLGAYNPTRAPTKPSSSNPACAAPSLASGLQGTCRALQALLGVQPPSSRAVRPPTKAPTPLPHRVAKRAPAILTPTPSTLPRGGNKRMRDSDDDEVLRDASPTHDQENRGWQCSTPKRPRRAAPPNMPLGLARRDFYALQSTPGNARALPRLLPSPGPHPERASDDLLPLKDHRAVDDGIDWDDEDDRALVALVLDKLRLSRADWEECARVLGTGETDGQRLGRRWRELMDGGQVGLRFGRGGVRKRERRGDVRQLWR